MTISSTQWIDRVIRDVSELDDRTSPDNCPEAMLVTADELRTIVERHIPIEHPDTTRLDHLIGFDRCQIGPVDTEGMTRLEKIEFVFENRADCQTHAVVRAAIDQSIKALMSQERKSPALNYDPADPDKMRLPVDTTCGQCVHIRRCKAIFGHTEADTYCDWSPSRFSHVAKETTS